MQFACIFIDITEQKRIEAELVKESLMRKVLLDNIPGCYAMVLKTNTREIVASNELAQKMGAVPGETCYHICAHRPDPCPFCRAEILWESHLPQRMEVEYQGRWYEEIWIYVSEELFVHYMVDITERKKAEMSLLNTQRLEALGILAGGIAHDFNNLLGGIFGSIEIAKDLTTESRIVERLEKAGNTIDRARGLTRQLLTFAKGGAPIRQVESLLFFIREIASFALSGSPVTCDFNIEENLWQVEVDKNQISQVINNLIINAQQAMPHGGEIVISAKNIILVKDESPDLDPGPYIQISIKDNGIGISHDAIVHIFDPFYSTKEKGHGLGLAICYSIITRHGGHIEVESEPDKGSLFRFYLPALPDSDIIPVSQKTSTHMGSGVIFVMDDEEVLLESIEIILSSLGYTVMTAGNGKDLIQYFNTARSEQKDIKGIIVDLTIAGGMGGRDVIQQIRKRDNHIPVLVMSGYAEDPIMANPPAFGFTCSIRKPFRRMELVKILNRYFV
jgi:signal transduction histidine kinase/CheY-like chemotaxis protein